MTYTVYSYRYEKPYYRYGITRVNLTLEEAKKVKAERMANPRRIANYIIVAANRRDEFEHKLNEANRKYDEWYEANVVPVVEKRSEELMEAYRQGYKVRDAVEYLHRGLNTKLPL